MDEHLRGDSLITSIYPHYSNVKKRSFNECNATVNSIAHQDRGRFETTVLLWSNSTHNVFI